MPKKTREQKIVAEYRRRMKLLPTMPASSKVKETGMRNFFLADVRKSLILIVFIIALEISLYFANISGTLERVLKF